MIKSYRRLLKRKCKSNFDASLNIHGIDPPRNRRCSMIVVLKSLWFVTHATRMNRFQQWVLWSSSVTEGLSLVVERVSVVQRRRRRVIGFSSCCRTSTATASIWPSVRPAWPTVVISRRHDSTDVNTIRLWRRLIQFDAASTDRADIGRTADLR